MINQTRMMEITGGDKELEKELLTLFLQTAESTLQRLEIGENWQKTVHELKGAAANIGMDTLHHRCAEIEHKTATDSEKKAFFAVINEHIAHLHTLIS
jgi:HPt (histidine-containing phosphotransfer) domain-containing protein